MGREIVEVFVYYWPRFIVSIWFALTNTTLSHKPKAKKRVVRDFVVMFFIACTTVSIITQYIYTPLYDNLFWPWTQHLPKDAETTIHLTVTMLSEGVSLIIPTYVFSRIIDESWRVGTTIYFMYVILDKTCLLLAFSPISYFFSFVVLVFLGIVLFYDKMKFVSKNINVIDWNPVFSYQLGLIFLLMALHNVYYIFPGINNGEVDLKSFWLYTVTLASFGFFAAFARLNIKASKAQAQKIQYMKELQDSERDIIQKFAEISEAKSGETGHHVKRVAEYSGILAESCGLTPEEVEHIRIASMMHDIGKLLVPREIIEKPGVLTDEEWNIMKEHTTYGNEILANSQGEEIVMSRIIAFQHHERWDGTGYPSGLSGEQISIYAQIVSVADVFDALTSRRAYKDPWDCEKAKAEILSQRGKQFSPKVVDVFEQCYDKFLEIRNTYRDEE